MPKTNTTFKRGHSLKGRAKDSASKAVTSAAKKGTSHQNAGAPVEWTCPNATNKHAYTHLTRFTHWYNVAGAGNLATRLLIAGATRNGKPFEIRAIRMVCGAR